MPGRRSSPIHGVRASSATTVLAWIALLAVLSWTLVRAFGLEGGYPLVPLIALTPYLIPAAAILAALALLGGRPIPAAGLAACAVVLCVLVLPRAFAGDPPGPRPEGTELRIVASNLLVGSADIEQLTELVADYDADVLVLTELTPEAAAVIERSPIADALPNAVLDARVGPGGSGIMSSLPLTREPAPGRTGQDLPTVIATAGLPGGSAAEIYAIHPPPPNTAEHVAANARYLDALPPAPETGTPRLLIGDFNATLDDSNLRDVVDSGYTDVADARGEGLAPTWPGGLYPPPVAIDHAIVDERAEALDFEAVEIEGSDHRAIAATIRLPSHEQQSG